MADRGEKVQETLLNGSGGRHHALPEHKAVPTHSPQKDSVFRMDFAFPGQLGKSVGGARLGHRGMAATRMDVPFR